MSSAPKHDVFQAIADPTRRKMDGEPVKRWKKPALFPVKDKEKQKKQIAKQIELLQAELRKID
ncbi:hypothetical protein C8P63_1287 [Melghirimyces profundicolus]|uniref:Uncharacterized protein n=1 Tax=Melghirimyces profundicolus TaxID=1242148 RepID=A0A2T6BCA1_9BACL|nr:hypothetical protein [Melghirimyces profundicolus]PTX53646.1 hypothetical protein C8P63_1287 [Melghirimyces profundicolus]